MARIVWKRFGDVANFVEPFAGSVTCAVNDDFARMTTRVAEGDEVAFLPPVSGGSPSCR